MEYVEDQEYKEYGTNGVQDEKRREDEDPEPQIQPIADDFHLKHELYHIQ
jgi:hypothetical protein